MINFKYFLPKGGRFFSFFLPVYLLAFAEAFNFFENPLPTPTPIEAVAQNALVLTVSSNAPICFHSTLQLSVSVNGGAGPFTYNWSGPGGFTATSANPTVNNVGINNDGNYFVTVTEPGTGMTGTGSVNVAFTGAWAYAGVDKYKCMGTGVSLSDSDVFGAAAILWTANPNVGTFVPNATTLHPTYIPPANFEGTIVFTLATDDPAGPCGPGNDQVTVQWENTNAINCNDVVSVSLGDDCTATVTPDMALEGDILEPLYQINLLLPNGTNIGNVVTSQYVGIPLTIKVTDLCNNNMCTTMMGVYDFIPPLVIDCSDIFVPCAVPSYTPSYLYNTLGIANAYPNVTDNCGPYDRTYIDTWVDLDCGESFNGYNDLSGYIKRDWTFTDQFDNISHCSQYIYFERVHVNDVVLPADVTINTSNTNCYPNVLPAVTGFPYFPSLGLNLPLVPGGNFCEMSVSYNDLVVSQTPGCANRAIIRTWTIYDFCLPTSNNPNNPNPKFYDQVINIIDDIGPSVDCPDDLTVNMDALTCCASVNLPDVIIEDNCSKISHATVTITNYNQFTQNTTTLFNGVANLLNFPGGGLYDTLAVFGITSCLPPGTHDVTYFFEDNCNNSSTCSFQLTVADNVPPVAACDEYTQVALTSDGMALVNATTFDDGSYDNCGLVYFKVRREFNNGCQPNNQYYDQVKFCCDDIGDTIDVVLRVYDVPVIPGAVSLSYQEDHSNECHVKVLVEDKLKPVCIPPPHTTVSCESFDPSLWAYGMATAADNCCVDTTTVSTNYSNFDTLCNKGTIVRTFRAFDCAGGSNQCTQRIVVFYEQDYFVKFPNDVIINECNGDGQYGAPTFFGEDCELLGVSYEDQVYTVVPDACFKIERTWTVINWCTYDPNTIDNNIYVPNPNPNATSNHPSNLPGPTVSAAGTPAPWAPTVVKINPSDQSATNYSSFWNPYANSYRYKQIIKIIDTEAPVFGDCPGQQEFCDFSYNDHFLWNESYWYDAPSNSHDLCEGPADLNITGTDSCSGSNVSFRYLLFLDLDGDGTMETVVNSVNPPPAGTVYYNNANTPNYTGGASRTFDERNVSASQKYRFAIDWTTSGNTKTAFVRWDWQGQPANLNDNTLQGVEPQLPYGTHKIKWFIMDGCGNENVCEYTFVVKDCKPPTVTCLNGLSVNMMPTGSISIPYSFFLQAAEDNCTLTPLLKFAIRKAGTGTGFPVNGNGSPIQSITFDCDEIGLQAVEIWAQDLEGNADFCLTYIIVQDNAGVCSPSGNATVAGALLTEDIDGVEDSQIEIQGYNPAGPSFNYFQMSSATGDFLFSSSIPLFSNYTLTPSKDDNPLNGVTTYDLVLISQHILGLEPLGSPYKMIAADANKSGSITTLDIVDLRRLILGITDELPNNTSWRFVDKAYTFPDPANPFQTQFPETKSVASIQANCMDDNFVAVKIGDVNGTAIPNTMMQTYDRSAGTLLFDAEDRTVKAGEDFSVNFRAADAVMGYQLTLAFPNLELIDIIPGEDMATENFGVFNDEHMLTTSFFGKSQASFELKFRAKADGQLSKLMSVSSWITRAEAYDKEKEKLDVALRFNKDGESTMVGVGFELYQNIPNPFMYKTLIGFHLPDATQATLTIYDDMGRTLHTITDQYPRGYNTVAIESSVLNSTGLLYYKLETSTDSAVRTMIRMQ